MRQWKDIPNYEGVYQISNDGLVMNLQTHTLKKPSTTEKGYLKISLNKNGKSMTFRVHRLVAQAFLPNPKNLPEINHINGDKTDNHVENLEWCNHFHNMRHAWENGLIPRNKSGRRKKPVRWTHNGVVKEFSSIPEAAKQTKICEDVIRFLIKNTNLGKWEFVNPPYNQKRKRGRPRKTV